MSLAANGATVRNDDASFTVLGVEGVEWLGKDNGIADTGLLDGDPNWPTGLFPGGKRLFPDARSINGVVEPKPRRDMRVRVTLNVPTPEPVTVHLRAFDVDDPTASSGPLDG